MHQLRSRGFTLIELLVVIAIIGILSAVVLASLNTARSKGNDAAIESDLSTTQTEAEIYYGGTGGNSYGTLSWTTNTNCLLNGGTGSMFNDPVVYKALTGAYNANGSSGVMCAANTSSYVAGAKLTATSGTWWCVDSTGAARQEPTSNAWPTSAISSCP